MRASARLSVRDMSTADFAIYDQILPRESTLLDLLEKIDWAAFDELLLSHYSKSGEGQPPYPPLILLKMEFLRFFYSMSQRVCVERCQTDLLFKFFLQLPVAAKMVDQSTLTRFRNRLGEDGVRDIFDRLVALAREKGLVKDNLRLKDATHILANVAIPTALGLFAQLRNRMLKEIEAWDPEQAASFRVELQTVRQETETQDDTIKLSSRVAMVTDLLEWMRTVPQPQVTGQPQVDRKAVERWASLQKTIKLAEKILDDTKFPTQGDKTRSVIDPDVRRGEHGDYYDGYLLDTMMDADSGLITAIDVLPANGEEAANAIALIQHEELVHGNNIEMLSMDGIGFNGEVLEKLEQAADGPGLVVITPPTKFNQAPGFESSKFELTGDGQQVRCPEGHLSGSGKTYKHHPNSTFFQFPAQTCRGCALLAACHPSMTELSKTGRRVNKNRFGHAYDRARQRSKTEEYARVRKRHSAIERKINEIARHNKGRRAKYYGRARVAIQELFIGLVVNAKRMLKLLSQPRNDCALASVG